MSYQAAAALQSTVTSVELSAQVDGRIPHMAAALGKVAPQHLRLELPLAAAEVAALKPVVAQTHTLARRYEAAAEVVVRKI